MGSSNKKRSNNNNMEHRTGLKQINNTKVRQSTKSKENKNITECLWVRYKRRKCHVAFLLISSFKFFFLQQHRANITGSPWKHCGCILKHLDR